jgi:putative membrane protein
MRAAAAFLEAEVFATRDRTGVLIFLALFEHRVVVLADSGIAARVEPGAWKGISDRLAAGIREGRAAAALIEAIGACGRLLAERRVERRPDDVSELPDHLRTSHD